MSRNERIEPMLPDLLGDREAIPAGLVGSRILAFGTADGLLAIDCKLPSGEVRRLTLLFSDRGLSVEHWATVD